MKKVVFSLAAIAALSMALPGRLPAQQCTVTYCGGVEVDPAPCGADATDCYIQCNNGYDAAQWCFYPDGGWTMVS